MVCGAYDAAPPTITRATASTLNLIELDLTCEKGKVAGNEQENMSMKLLNFSVTLTEMMTMMATRINVVIVTRTGAAEGWMTVVDLCWRLRLPAKCDVCGVKGIGMGRWGRKKAGG
uniref:Uncharacterized protein n=1 Tax=Ascaris lumbricoides TaxID=6252 RepID=A0A0M3I4K4_ASCLU